MLSDFQFVYLSPTFLHILYKILKKKWQRNLPRHINLHDIRQLDISDIEGLAIKYSYPLWFVQLLAKHLDIAEVRSILESMNREYYWLRVNTLKMDVDKAIKALEKHGVIVEQDKDLWYMLKVLKYSKPLYELELIRKGCVIIQDKGSALVVEALKPQIGDEILDACAAPGVKTSLIMQLTENRSKIIAVDLSRERVKSMVKLLKTFGVKLDNVDIVIADSMKTLLRRKADKALVDAPCSSSGTVSRDPAVKIHLNDVAWVKRFPIIQKRILSSIITLAYETVYATCSLIPWEGEEVVEEVLSTAPCKLEHLTIIGDPGYQSYHKVCNNVKRLYPHKYQVEGFFIAKLFTQEC